MQLFSATLSKQSMELSYLHALLCGGDGDSGGGMRLDEVGSIEKPRWRLLGPSWTPTYLRDQRGCMEKAGSGRRRDGC